MNTKWVDDNPYLAAAIVMFMLGFIAGFGKVMMLNTPIDLGRVAVVSIIISIFLTCVSIWQYNVKKDPRNKAR